MGNVWLDWETYCENPIDNGLSKYVNHNTFEPLCLAYCINGRPISQWLPDYTCMDCPAVLCEAIDNGCLFHAHNAAFEKTVWDMYAVKVLGWPGIPDILWRCTAAKAAYSGFPRKLQKLSDLLGLGDKSKDKAGHNVMMRLTKPYKNKRVYDPKLYQILYDYNKQDVVAEVEVDGLCRPFPPSELAIWRLDQKINRRGVPIDLALCRGASKIIAEETEAANKELSLLTNGAVGEVTKLEKLKTYLIDAGVPVPTKVNKKNKVVPTLDKNFIENYEHEGDPTIARVIEIRKECGSAAIQKYNTALDWTDEDGLCRHTLKYFEAGPGRWASRGPQFHNMVREKNPPQCILDAITSGETKRLREEIDKLCSDPAKRISPLNQLAKACRAMIHAPEGRTFVLSDFAGIEARICAWIAEETRLLDQFFAGADVYVTMACDILGCTEYDIIDTKTGKVDKSKRQLGKVPFLGATYQMAWRKLQVTAKQQAGVTLSDELAQSIVDVFRSKYKKVPDLWKLLERGAKTCVQTGKPIVANKYISYHMDGKWLIMTLPSGRDISYYNPVLNRSQKWGYELVYDSPKGKKQIYGGLLTENAVQATSRDLLAEAMIRMDAAGLDILLTVHDEIIVETALDSAESCASIVHKIMCNPPAWAASAPIGAETNISPRFTKF